MNRKKFIEFLGLGAVGIALPISLLGSSASSIENNRIEGVGPTFEDDVVLAPGLKYKILISWGEEITNSLKFGSHNDYIAFLPKNEKEALLWVNHEYFDQLLVSGILRGSETSKKIVDKERLEIGGSIVKIKKGEDGLWAFEKNEEVNKRMDGFSAIPFANGVKVAGNNVAIGTFANCSGGVTPWGTVLTCEENYDMYYGERMLDGSVTPSAYQWEKHYQLPPEHYGWVVEVDCDTGKALKHTSLGRCYHECATVVHTKDKTTVVYTGDDMENECLYKFISMKKDSLTEGTLYVASLEKKKWIPLDIEKQVRLKEKFSSQLEVMVNLREASKIVGGTPLDRPEDIDIDPITGGIFISLTNNVPAGNYFGSILKITEKGDYDSLEFEYDTFLVGGEETGFACPDNMAFDTKGNLWFTSDISGSKIGSKEYQPFKNNGLFLVPRKGQQKGEVIQMASAPVDAEFTGPCFTPDGKTLFLSVQHPGERTVDLRKPTSNWPDGGDSLPKSSVIQIYGDF